MFLHLGKDVVIPIKDIIAIIDAKTAMESDDTLSFIKIAEEEGFIKVISEKGIKSYIITEKTQKDKTNGGEIRTSVIYGTNISSSTLYKRTNFIDSMIKCQ
ncbi:extracellular matrix regulator RemB [Dethiothermospora halolimnae]|uniref:extracellular matrix regulator RemB n=1 Tax=Dethiothermospora halolimnae TaxID=3114390 RepID=UPI003CCBB3EE